MLSKRNSKTLSVAMRYVLSIVVMTRWLYFSTSEKGSGIPVSILESPGDIIQLINAETYNVNRAINWA